MIRFQNTSLIVLMLLVINNSYSQQNSDTNKLYLNKMMIKLMSPHTDMNFSFGTLELKNEKPDLNIEIPNLKDTVELINKLNGSYNDWNTFNKIADLYKRFNNENFAYNYYEMAYNTITRAIQNDTTNSKYFSDMGNLYMALNNKQQAFGFYQKAYELNNNDTSAYNALPMFYIFMGENEKAKNILNEVIKKDDKNLNAYIWFVTMNIMNVMQNNNLDSNKLSSIDEIFNLKLIKELSQKYKKEIKFEILYNLSKTMALFVKYSILSKDIETFNVSKTDLNEIENLQVFYNKIISKNKFENKYILYKALGFTYLIQKNQKDALLNLRKSMDYWPKDKLDVDYYILFSINYFLADNRTEAVRIIKEKISENIKLNLINSVDNIILANSYLNMSENSAEYINLAKIEYEKAISYNKYLKDAYLGLAVINLLTGSALEQANEYINFAYEIDKNYYLTYALFGVITLLNNENEKAENAFKQALQLKPDDELVNEIYKAYFK
ncbi:MAG: hypothetical protein JXR51_04700 [Bacteroidales bacterium]|nr:hypothetical protein [Bacteroidales bacterium]